MEYIQFECTYHGCPHLDSSRRKKKKKIFAEGTKLKKSLYKKGRNWTDAMEMLVVNPESFSKPLKFSFVWEILFITYLASHRNCVCCLVRLLPRLTGFTNQITGQYSHSSGFVFYDDGLCKKLKIRIYKSFQVWF